MNSSMLSFTPTFSGNAATGILPISGDERSGAFIDFCVKRATSVAGQLKDFVRSAYDSYLEKDNDLTALHLYLIAVEHRNQFASICPEYEAVFTTDMVAKLTHIQHLGNLLGQRAYYRLSELVKVEHDWDDDGAKPMSISSLDLLHSFVRRAKIAPSDLGLFLGYNGEILINWHMRDGGLIDIAFRDGMIEIYTDDGEESYAPADVELYRFIDSIK